MRWLILTQYFPPEIGAAPTRLFELARELRKRGHSVTVVTAMPNYPKGEVLQDYKGKWIIRENIDGINVIRTSIYTAMGNGYKRMVNYLSFNFSSVWGLLEIPKVDFVFVESPPLFLGLNGYLISRFKKARFIFNISDLWPDWPKEIGLINNRLLIRIMEKIEAFIYRKADYISTVTYGITDTLVGRKGVPREKMLFLPNGVDTELFKKVETMDNLQSELGLNDKKIFLYAGNHGIYNRPFVILESALLLNEYENIHFLLIGDGSTKPEMLKFVKQKALKNVTFLDSKPISDIPRYYNVATGAIVTYMKGFTSRSAKLFPAMASSSPIIYSGEGEGADLVKEGKCGLVVEPENPRALAEAIIRIADNPTLAEQLGENGRKFVEERFSWDKLVGTWLEELETREQDRARILSS